MAAKQNKENMFVTAAKNRQKHQDSLQQSLTQQDGDQADQRTSMTVCMSLEDKIKLKMLAAKSDKTVSKLIHEWLAEQDV